MPDQILRDRVAFVTGGSSGIGAACVAVLAAAGAKVCIGYHGDEEGAGAGAAVCAALGAETATVKVDVSDEASVEAAFDACAARLGLPDLLINSAGVNMRGTPVAEMSLAQWNGVIGADLTGSFLTSRRFVRDLLAAKRPGTIVNITSIHAFAMRAGAADYDAAKGGQANLTRTLALEVADAGITVNAIAPGMILTPMNADAQHDADKRRELEANIPAKRAGKPEEIARVALFLASPDAAYITGTTVVVDGGLSLLMGQGA